MRPLAQWVNGDALDEPRSCHWVNGDALDEQHSCHCEKQKRRSNPETLAPVRHEIATAALLSPRDDRLRTSPCLAGARTSVAQGARRLKWLTFIAVIGWGAGCGTSPPARFFTLATEPPAALTPGEAKSISILVGPVSVPELVDRPQLVLRTSPTRVELAEQARWAAPLKSAIPGAMAAQLARLLPGARVTTSSQRASDIPDARVLIDIQRFDSTLNESAVIEASWTVRLRDGTSVGGRSVAKETAGAGYDELVAAHSRALDVISRDIAAAIAPALE